MLAQFKQHIEQNFPELLHHQTLLAVSGGVDSMVLLHLFQMLKLDFAVAHCNFQLRDEESDLDEALVQKYCLENKIAFHLKRFDTVTYTNEQNVSIQIAARELRYSWFEELCKQSDYSFVATAHHLDDQVETFLINFTRGTGIGGLVGIPERNGKVVRPLLPFSREEIQKHAVENGILWREDASNQATKYLRNKIRHLIVPVLKEENLNFLQSFQNTLTHLKNTQFLAGEALKFFKEQCVQKSDQHIHINLEQSALFSDYLIYLSEFLKDFGFLSVTEIEKIFKADSGKLLKNDKFTLLKNRGEFIIIKNIEERKSEYHINTVNDFSNLPVSLLLSKVSSIDADSDKNTIFVDAELLKWPLVLRKKKQGETFVPFGMQGIKKVSKFFKDEKLSIVEKDQTWLLVNNDEKIIWIVGLRADNRFRVTSKTNKIYKLSLNQ